MTETQLFLQINSLPEAMKKEVVDFIEFLQQKLKPSKKKKERKFGCAKGFFIMKDNFDEPIDDFKDYM
ncbi:MAG: hypothetical protein A2X08_04915 [Bacteroidetes bacterium GWA2_32_17]|nr:MAG: hypothetical protein A2X08_04915 [Bacteroidetes bacterium GWA2_32_17]